MEQQFCDIFLSKQHPSCTSVQPVGVKLPLHYREALGMIFTPGSEGVAVSSLPLADREKKNLVMNLWAEGLLQVHQWKETNRSGEVLI